MQKFSEEVAWAVSRSIPTVGNQKKQKRQDREGDNGGAEGSDDGGAVRSMRKRLEALSSEETVLEMSYQTLPRPYTLVGLSVHQQTWAEQFNDNLGVMQAARRSVMALAAKATTTTDPVDRAKAGVKLAALKEKWCRAVQDNELMRVAVEAAQVDGVAAAAVMQEVRERRNKKARVVQDEWSAALKRIVKQAAKARLLQQSACGCGARTQQAHGDWQGGDWQGGNWQGGDWQGGDWQGAAWHMQPPSPPPPPPLPPPPPQQDWQEWQDWQDWQDCSWQDWQGQQPDEQQGQPDDWCEAEWLEQGYSWNPVTQAWVLEG